MCEFTVLLDREPVYKDAVYAKVEGPNIQIKDVLGVSKIFKNCRITEVDVSSERLVLAPVRRSR